LLGLRVINVYDVDNKTYLIKLAKLVSFLFEYTIVIIQYDINSFMALIRIIVHLYKIGE